MTGLLLLVLVFLALSSSRNLERDHLRATCFVVAKDVVTRPLRDVRARALAGSLTIVENLFSPEDVSETVLVAGPSGLVKPWIEVLGKYRNPNHTLAYGFTTEGGDECWVVVDSTRVIATSDSVELEPALRTLRERLRYIPRSHGLNESEEDSEGRLTSASYEIPRADVRRYALTCYLRTKGSAGFQLDLYECRAWAGTWVASGAHLDHDIVPRSSWEPEVLRLARRWGIESTDSGLAYVSLTRRNLTQSVYIPLLGTTLELRSAAVIVSVIALALSILLHQHLSVVARTDCRTSGEPWDMLGSHTEGAAGILSWFGARAYVYASLFAVLTPGIVGVIALILAIGRGSPITSRALLVVAGVVTAAYSVRNSQLLARARANDRLKTVEGNRAELPVPPN